MASLTQNPSQRASPQSVAGAPGSLIIGESVNVRILSLLRCVLAFLGLTIVCVGASESRQSAVLTYGPLVLYSFYSLIIVYQAFRAGRPLPPKVTCWADVFFYAYSIAITGATYGFFFLFFFYPILVASFSWGFRQGMLVTTVSMVSLVAVEFAFSPPEREFFSSGTLINAAYLFVFGYMISYLGGYERFFRLKLALLKEINNQWSPRLGVDHAHVVNLERLSDFYGADSCVLVVRRPTLRQQYVMYSVSRVKPGRSTEPAELDENTTAALLRLPETLASCYHDPDGPWWLRFHGYSAFEFGSGTRTLSFSGECAIWANLLDARAFVTVPYSQHDGTVGRIFLTSSSHGFSDADIDFLSQASDAMSTVIENMYLIEELVAGAAEHERQSISRDLHDTTIQPYIGLKLALDALHREAGENTVISKRIAELIDMAETTVRDLRGYAAGLRDKAVMPGEYLVTAVQKQTERLRRIYGINVEVKSDISSRLKGRLAADAFQIISEGLSNVLRHTSAKNAFVNILCENSHLLLKIGNERNIVSKGEVGFMPRSIFERARALGGVTFVESRSDNYTVVHVAIPI